MHQNNCIYLQRVHLLLALLSEFMRSRHGLQHSVLHLRQGMFRENRLRRDPLESLEARIRLYPINFSFEHLLDKEKTDLALYSARQNMSIPNVAQFPHLHVVFPHNKSSCIMNIVCLQKSCSYLFRHISLISVFFCSVPWLKHCIGEFTFRRWWPRCTNEWVSCNQHVVVAIRKRLGCQFNHFVRFHRECAVEITRCVVSIQFRVHVGACLQVFCVHCICSEIMLDWYI